jgi:uncharacterized protein
MILGFEWDEEKASANAKKHRVSFEEAVLAFSDPMLITFSDPLHAESEESFLSIGISSKDRVLIVAHTDRSNKVRIVNCRKATASERKRYEEKD